MSEAPEGPEGSTASRRTCDQCRARKVRCDRETPCSNCRITQRNCSFTGAGQKPRTARQRVLISHQYENKIDNFEARLAGIEGMLRDLTTSLKRVDISTPRSDSGVLNYTPSATEPSTLCENLSIHGADTSDQEFEGSSSLAAHTTFASEFFEQAVTKTSLSRQLSPDMQKALASLQQLVRNQNRKEVSQESRFAHQKLMPRGGYSQLPLPPTDIVLKVLRKIKQAPPMAFMMNCIFVTVDDFIDSCRRIYFPTEDYNIATFITVNTGLYYLFQENAIMELFPDKEYSKSHMICRDNLETALANLPLLLPAKKDMVEALLLGASYAVDISKMSLAWQLNSAAANICQTLGWHRLQTIKDEGEDAKVTLFWFCYMLDKGLALRFGRACVIQDWDISVPRHFGNGTLPESWNAMATSWIHTGGILGDIYEHLYSPSALARAPSQRIETARLLVDKMKQVWTDMENLSITSRAREKETLDSFARDPRNEASLQMIHKSGKVTHLSSLTLIYRAIPSAPGFPSTFNTECIDAARAAFECHFECMQLLTDDTIAIAGYLHWTILYSPFTPFIVLFCHVIETSNLDDLRLLDRFSESLQPALPGSQAMEKLYRQCKLLHQIATLYIDAKGQQQQDSDMNIVGNDLDNYLTQLGFISQTHINIGERVDVVDGESTLGGVPTANQGQELGDWFSGNRYVMGLMDEDFLDIDTRMW